MQTILAELPDAGTAAPYVGAFVGGITACATVLKLWVRFHPKMATQAQTIREWERRHGELEKKMAEAKAEAEAKEKAREAHEKERDRARAEKDKLRLERETRMRRDIEDLRNELNETKASSNLIVSMGRKARIALLANREKGIENALIYLEVFEDIQASGRSGAHSAVHVPASDG